MVPATRRNEHKVIDMPYKDLDKRRKCTVKAVARFRKNHGYKWWEYSENSRVTDDERRKRIDSYQKEREDKIEIRSQTKDKVLKNRLNQRIYVLTRMIEGHLNKLQESNRDVTGSNDS